MNLFAGQTMDSSIKYILCLSMLIIKLSLIQGYDSRSDFRMSDNLKGQLETVMKDLKSVKEDLKEEKVKSVILEKQLNALKDESQRTLFNDKAFYDEKKQRKRFENEMRNNFKDQREHVENKISSLNNICLARVDIKLKTFEDKVLHSVTTLNDKAINHLRLESKQQNTTLLRHDAMLVSLNDSVTDVQSSIVELKDTCHYKDPHPTDCLEVLKQNKNKANGVYNVQSPFSGLVYPVYCDMTTDDGGWTVFQKRFDGRLDFYRTFKEYEDGFGDVNAEFWMGLKRIHDMTAHHETELRIHVTAADGSSAYETFQDFSVSPGPDYILHVGQAAGTAGDAYHGFTWNNGMKFSTKDKDVDGYGGRDCAEALHGGWWYNRCTRVNLNGDYVTPGTYSSYDGGWGGVTYFSFKQKQSLKTTTIMFRRK